MRGIGILALAALALAVQTASAQNMSQRGPAWAQSILASDVTPTTGGRAALSEAGIVAAARITIAPLQGGVARVVRFEVRGDAATLALRRFTGHPATGWWMWGPDTPYITHPNAATRDEVLGLIRSAIGIAASLNSTGSDGACASGEQVFVEMAVADRSVSATRACVDASEPVGRLAARLSELGGSRDEEQLDAAATAELLAADRAFAAMAQAQGVPAAFAEYAAADAILMRNGEPVQGAAAVAGAHARWPQGARLQWAPAGGDVSERGDMGWTWGRSTFTGADGVAHAGRYVSVWKRDLEGHWRFAFDAPIEGAAAAPARATPAPNPAPAPH